MQTTLLGLAIAFILALIAALVGPYFIDWNQFRPQFEAEASKVIGAPVRVGGSLDARLLPTPTLQLHSVVLGGANDLGKIHADKLDVEFSLSDLMRGEWRASRLTVDGLALDLGLDPQGRIDWPASNGTFDFASLAIDRLDLTGRVALHDAASRSTLELNDIAFSGDVRSLAGSVRGDGRFAVAGTRYPFRISSGQSADGRATRVHLTVDPGERPLSIDLDGQLSFEARAPRFEGTAVIAKPPPKKGAEKAAAPWRVTSKVKANYVAAQFEQIEASYGAEDRAMKLTGSGDVRFGGAPLLRLALAARQLDADRLMGGGAGDPMRLVPMLHAWLNELPIAPLRTRIEAGAEQIMLGGRPLQNVSLDMHGGDAASWAVDRLAFRAPGATQVSFTAGVAPGPSDGFAGSLEVGADDPDGLLAWLLGKSEVVRRTPKPLRLGGEVAVTRDRVAVERLKAAIDGGMLEGRISLSSPPSSASRLDAALKAERLDLDAASAFVRSLAGPDAAWPDEAAVSLDIASAVSSGQELRPFSTAFDYGPKTLSLKQLKIGQPGGVMVDGSGQFDRNAATGHFVLNANAASLGQVTTMIAPLAPAVAARLDQAATDPGPARLKLQLDIARNAAKANLADAHAAFELSAPQLNATAAMNARPDAAALRGFDLDKLGQAELSVDAKGSAGRAATLIALLGLDKAVAAGEGGAQFEGSAAGAWKAPIRLSAKLWGAGIDAEIQGTAEPWASPRKASASIKARSIDLAPAFGFRPADPLAQNIRLFSRATLSGDKLTLDDIDSVVAGSRLRGHLALTLDDDRAVDGEIGLDSLDLASSLALAIGAVGHPASDPLSPGLMSGWRGRVAFQALRGALPGGAEVRPLSGAIRGDGRALILDDLKGKIGGGEATATFDARPDANGIAINARLDLSGVDGSALRYRGLKMPAGRTSLQMTLMSRGRSVAALSGGLSGSGTVTLQSAEISGLDAHAFDAAIRASDAGQVADDIRLKQIVAPVLSAGKLPVAAAQIPFNIRDGRLRIDTTTLDAGNARVTVSGGYDMPADQVDLRVAFSTNATGSVTSRPEVQLFAAGTPDSLTPMLDVTPLSSYLAVRTIDRETRRLDAIDRGEAPPADVSPAPPSTAALPLPSSPADVPMPGRDPRRPPPRATAVPAPRAPMVGQQAAPLPPPIEVRPVPGSVPAPPRPRPPPRPPMVLTPSAQP